MNLLLEIGTEEIPDWMIPDALSQMRVLFDAPCETEATCRRLVLRATDLPERQPDREEYVAGPAISAPAQAIDGFVRKQGIAKEALEQREGKYGYVRHTPGQDTATLLSTTLPNLIAGIKWPKSMFWTAKGGPKFIRPIRWIVAVLDHKVIPFEFAGVPSSNQSSGHRRLGKPSFPVTTETYEQELRANGVILKATERRQKIQSELPPDVRPDPKLLETLVYLTEFPTVVIGEFDEAFLTFRPKSSPR